MKNRIKIIAIFLFILIFSSCINNNKSKVNTLDNNNKYAINFKLIKGKNYTLLHILNPENKSIEHKYYLSKEKGNSKFKDYKFIQTPIKSIIALSSTNIGMLEKLNESKLISGVSGIQFIHNPTVLKNYEKGKVIQLGDESSVPSELILKSKTKIVMYSGFGKSFPKEQILEKLGVLCMPNYDWKEENPLGKAEWIKVMGALTDHLDDADKQFNIIEKEYKKLLKITNKTSKRPTVISGNLVGDVWFSPAGQSYHALLFKDAKTDYIYKNSKGTGSTKNTLEKIIMDNINTDFWMNPGVETLKEIEENQPKLKILKAFKTKNIYSYSFSGNRFWENSAIEPHHILSDYIQIFHPELHLKNKLYFYKKLN